MKVTRHETPGRQEVRMSFSSHDELEAFVTGLEREALAEKRGLEAPIEPIRTVAWVGEQVPEIESA